MRSASIFDPTGDLFWPSLYSCIGLTVVMVGGGLIWEVFIMTKSLKQAKTGRQHENPVLEAFFKVEERTGHSNIIYGPLFDMIFQ